MSKSIAIVELKFHEELLLPQITALLRDSYQVHLITNAQIAASESLDSIRNKISIKQFENASKFVTKLKMLIEIPKYLKKHVIGKLVINTLDSTFCQMLLKRINGMDTFGFIHNADKFLSHQKFHSVLKNVKHPMVLGAYISKYLHGNDITAVPVYLTEFGFVGNSVIEKSCNIIQVVIPGQLDRRRRAYDDLIDACSPDMNIRFILLGNANKADGPDLIEKIKERKLEQQFKWFNQFVPHEGFIEGIESADYIMPLVHSNCLIYSRYQECKATAAFMWAIAANKMMLMEDGFKQIDEFHALSEYYDAKKLSEFLTSLAHPEGRVDLGEQHETIKNNYLAIINAS
jgi:hypothetical protein